MNRIPLLWLTLLTLLAPSSWGQMMKASGSVYSRVEGSELQVTLQIRIEPSFHLYHHELGASDSVGKPLKIEFESDDVEFDELWWPEPHRYEQPGLGDGGRDTFILGHGGKLVLYGHATLDEGVTEPEFKVKLDGLTCEDGGSCFPYFETLETKGAGRDKYWKDYPTAFWAEGAGAAEADEPEEDQVGDDHLSGGLYVRQDGETVCAVLELTVPESEHLGHTEKGNPDGIAMDTVLVLRGEGIEWSEAVWPEPEKTTPDWGGENDWVYTHHGTLRVTATGRADEGADLASISARLEGQVCEDSGSCYQVQLSFANVGAGDDAWFAAAPADSADGEPSDSKEPEKKKEGLWGLIIAAIGGGIFALLMPCTYPMIPITISFFTKQAEARHGSVLPLSLLYGAGIILIFIAIGVVVGRPIIEFATHPVTNLIMGSMFVLFAAVLFGALTLNPPQFLMQAAGKASMKGGLIGVFLMGMTLVLTSFTCTAPFVGNLLVVAGQSESGGMGRIVLGMGVFGLTMAVPFVLLSLFPARLKAMPSSGEWMDTLKISLGFIELAAALKFFSNSDIKWQWLWISRELFLLMWAAIFIIGAAYLFGLIKLKGHAAREIGAGRMLGAMAFLAFGLYCLHGYNGHRMDSIMSGIIPNYSSALSGRAGASVTSEGGGHGSEAGHTYIEDDFDKAKDVALEQGKPVLINFTGLV